MADIVQYIGRMKTTTKMTVVLPDGGRVNVRSLREASEAFTARRDALDFGSSDCVRDSGLVTGLDGKDLAQVSYNGRIWEPREGGAEILAAAEGK